MFRLARIGSGMLAQLSVTMAILGTFHLALTQLYIKKEKHPIPACKSMQV
jgi:hypothetical protein